MNVTDEMGEMMAGRFFPAILDLWTKPSLFGDFFYLILFFIVATIAYMGTQNAMMPLLIGLVFIGVGMAYLPAVSQNIILIILGIIITGLFWKMFIGRK